VSLATVIEVSEPHGPPRQMNAYILYISFEMLIPMSASLKYKRRIIKSLKTKLRGRYNASVAEVEHLDKWQRATIAVVLVSNEKSKLVKDQTAIELMINDYAEIELVKTTAEWL